MEKRKRSHSALRSKVVPKSTPAKYRRLDHHSPKTLVTVPPEIKRSRSGVCSHLRRKLQRVQSHYHQTLTELNFLQGGQLLVNYYDWRLQNRASLAAVLSSGHLDKEDLDKVNRFVNGQLTEESFFPPVPVLDGETDRVQDSLTLNQSLAYNSSINILSTSLDLDPFENDDLDENTVAEIISRKAIEEANVLRRVAQLKREGMWTEDARGKIDEPPESNTFHLDNLFTEMQWLADDFGRERHWKKASAKKLAYAAVKWLKEKEERGKKAAKDEVFRTRKLAAAVSKMIRDWWRQMDKIVQAKQQVRLAAKRQEAMNTHLGKVIETTERYTEWLTEGLQVESDAGEDAEFRLPVDLDSEEDDEETIDREEIENGPTVEETQAEVDALQRESEVPMDELLSSLPQEVLEGKRPPSLAEEEEIDEDSDEITQGTEEKASSEKMNDDDEFKSDAEDSEDDETTLKEQENHETVSTNYQEEVDALAAEADIPIEELLKQYQQTTVDGMEVEEGSEEAVDEDEENGEDGSDSEEDESSEESEESSSEEEEESEKETSDEEDDVSLKDFFGSDNLKSSKIVELNGEKEKVVPSVSAEKAAPKPAFKGEEEFNALSAEAMSLQPTGYTLESTHVKVSVPFLLKHELREYQYVGLDWLATIYEKRLNGILADEMGLGKTIQTIALLAHLACDKGIWGPHLIVVPTSVMLNWEMEFKKWCPGFKILTYYGSLKERKEKRKGWTKTNAFHVCITSYKLAIQDSLMFKRKKWKYLILDEAQNIKNFKSQRWQTLLTFNSQRRLLLTGTPLQNSLMELWSLMHFLMPHVFQSHREFQEWFASPLTGMIEGNSEYNEELVLRLHKVLRPFILRRLKKDVEKQMPKKYEHVIMCRVSRRQRFLYDDFMSLTATRDTLEGGQFLSVINVLMQLRKVCNHPNLLEPRPIISPFTMSGLVYTTPRLAHSIVDRDNLKDYRGVDAAMGESLADMARDLPGFVAERILQLKPRQNIIQEVDTTVEVDWMAAHDHDEPVNQRTFIPRGVLSEIHDEYCKKLAASGDGVESPTKARVPLPFPKLATPSHFEVEYKKVAPSYPPSESDLPKPIVRSRRNARSARLSLMVRINEQRCSQRPLFGPDLVRCLQRLVSQQADTRWVGGYLHCERAQCVRPDVREPWFQFGVESRRTPLTWQDESRPLRQLVPNTEDRLVDMEDILRRFVFAVPSAVSRKVQLSTSNVAQLTAQQRPDERLLFEVPLRAVAPLHRIASQQQVQFPEARLIQYDCGKLQTLQTLLRDLKSGSHRVLIFTQMTRMLDILEQFLSYHGHRYLRLDGATKVEQRQILMERFNMDPKIFVFILSTRSGGLGVNLTGADTVIFYDSDWNPTMDAQAQDRCHRIGQTRDVHIYRLISLKTIEENILKKASQKRFLSDVAIEGGKFTTAFFKKNTLQELFEEPTGLEDLAREKNAAASSSAPETSDVDSSVSKLGGPLKTRSGRHIRSRRRTSPRKPTTEGGVSTAAEDAGDVSETQFEAALEEFEDEQDRVAAKHAKSEAKADLAEFDESIPWDEQESRRRAEAGEQSRAEKELSEFHQQLRPIERFGVTYMESAWGEALAGELELADARLEQSKVSWELEQLKALREEEEMRAEVEEDDMLYVYGKYDPATQRRELARLKREEAEIQRKEAESAAEEEEAKRRVEEARKRRAAAASLAAAKALAQKKVRVAAGRGRGGKGPVRKVAPARFELPSDSIVEDMEVGVMQGCELPPKRKMSPVKRGNAGQMNHRQAPSSPLTPLAGPPSLRQERPQLPQRVPIPRLHRPNEGYARPRPPRMVHPSSSMRVPPERYQQPNRLPQQRMQRQLQQPIQMAVSAMPSYVLHQQQRPLMATSIGPHRMLLPLPTQAPRPPRPQPPPRPPPVFPQFAVQNINGVRSVLPGNQLILNGQPVLVITRQTKTPSGEIIEQRFTQPINPTPQFTQVSQRMRNGFEQPTPTPATVCLTLSASQFLQPRIRTMTSAGQSGIRAAHPRPLAPRIAPLVQRPSTVILQPGLGGGQHQLLAAGGQVVRLLPAHTQQHSSLG